MKSAKISGALIICMGLFGLVGAGSAFAGDASEFGIAKFTNTYHDPTGEPLLQAGVHPDVSTGIFFKTGSDFLMNGLVRDFEVDLPAGFYGNPQAIPSCSQEDLIVGDGLCNPAAQVGVYHFNVGATEAEYPVYNLGSPDEQTAVLAVVALGVPAKIVISARTDGDYGLIARVSNVNQALPLTSTILDLWGVPAAAVHDPQRWGATFDVRGVSAGIPVKPFLSLPARCEPVTTELHVDSWQNPGPYNPDGSADLSDPRWVTATDTTPPLEGCEDLGFAPTLKARPTTSVADSPSGLESDLEIPQSADDPEQPSSAHLRKTVARLPEGLVINPAGANGLEACSPAQIGLKTAVGAGNPSFDKLPARCPDAAKIGSAEVNTPLLADPLKGSIYAASPYDNPFGNLLTTYTVLEGKGLVIKIAGKVTPDPVTGQLTAVFDQTPQLTFEHFKQNFFGGAYGVLRTPSTCGKYATTATMTPWSAPDTPTVDGKDEYAIAKAPTGGSCAAKEAERPHAPSFEGGSTSPIAGVYKPFVVNLSRKDGTQQFSAVTLSPPPGLVAKLAGTLTCTEAGLAAAAAKTGNQEKSSPSCPAASKVGEVWAAAGAGPAPYNAPGKVYLAGPYKGAPLSFAFVVPATAGPYDLGTVVTRAAAYIDPITAQVKTVSDPLPTILKGIPLDVRSISVRLDKPDFTVNPTSCDPSAVTGTLFSTAGLGAALDNRFQVGECGRLKFSPQLSIKLKGVPKRTGNPAVTAVLTMPEGQANIKKTTVILPKTEFIDNAHINNPCTRVQFNEDACPASSILGTARAFTPLLDEPLEGPVYFRSNGGDRELPDMVVDLDGQIHVTLVGFIDSVPVKGTESTRVRTRFVNVPDAPVSKFVLKLYGGKRGLIENSVNLCKAKVGPASVQMEAQNAKTAFSDLPLGTSCSKKSKKRR
ncbi:MAG TPA: hypothetical protein VLK37_12910 [Solirubrobacterales bacterium]|nr:hypothetical protein [Solirubrobacterales bacterium]